MRYKEIHHLESQDYVRYLSPTFGLSVDGKECLETRISITVLTTKEWVALQFIQCTLKWNCTQKWHFDSWTWTSVSQLNHSFFAHVCVNKISHPALHLDKFLFDDCSKYGSAQWLQGSCHQDNRCQKKWWGSSEYIGSVFSEIKLTAAPLL